MKYTALPILIFVVLVNYATHVVDLPLRGEESRWGQVAREMEASGDWIVPREQGEPFHSRPPFHSWLIALSAKLVGGFNVWALRLPSLFATLGATLLVYFYVRRFASWSAALVAGLAFATSGATMQNARLAETESVYLFVVAGSLLLWHIGYTANRSRGLVWAVGYALAACALLTKGPQGVCYFIGPTFVYLLWQRDWRWLVSWGHLFGIAVFVAIVGTWLILFARQLGGQGVYAIFTGDIAMRFQVITTPVIVMHLLTYPLEIFAVLMPWSAFLPAYLSRSVRDSLGTARPMVGFVAVCIAVTFPTCWFVPTARTRYFMTMFPMIAILVAPIAQQLFATRVSSAVARGWKVVVYGTATVMVAAGVAVIAVSWVIDSPRVQPYAQASWVVVVYSTLIVGLVAAMRWAEGGLGTRRVGVAIAALVLFMSASSTWVGTNHAIARAPATIADIEKIRMRIAPTEELISFGPIHHLFAFHFDRPIRLCRSPKETGATPYFCYTTYNGIRLPLPFEYEELAVVSMDRTRTANPSCDVIVGVKLPR